ncbi:MAG: hypothetical protein QOJ49_1386 [Actinomycetota bacterium]|jgi:steroid delta-isomerase-like uncharacterized protein|nr:hypothetical protein [Actinomycetota bacterium]
MSGNAEVAISALHALAAAEMDALERLYAPDFVFHTQLSGRPEGHAGLRDRALMISSALYDANLSVEIVVEKDDMVVCRWRGHAVHKGDLLGVPGTGRQVEAAGITIFRIVDGAVAEEWTEFDGLGLLNQIGGHHAAVPAAKPPVPAPTPAPL